MNIEEVFKKCGEAQTLCRLWDYDGEYRIVEPYMIYTSRTGKRLFHVYQLDGYSRSRQSEGWKNPRVDSFESIETLPQQFTVRPEYNPFNMQMFPIVHFSIPTITSQVRV